MADLKKHPSKAQFDALEADLWRVYASQYFRIDGYLVSACTGQVGMKVEIVVYVNGYCRGRDLWRGNEAELDQIPDIARKFQRLCSKRINSAARIKLLEKYYGKRNAEKEGVYAKHYYTWHSFSTARTFIAHIKKHNDSIEILSYEDYSEAIALLPSTEGNGDE